ncbi:phosphoadenosine phosphosulfate reductase [Halocynthiibacter sp. C4]|uniref:phosphoadenosine phosphosulfate reductase n=1 Tax=Halocynthiibacter sp. C4 TaxID=2992758 RepID=UPI00237AB768|nr:phosphoadenosine phosphosulfate reductase [Halocynthiibacter sp. C4]MDE0589310.1 phosphoadenosine phosphosulfate reductase [Halocynthiibacter sp. C4]
MTHDTRSPLDSETQDWLARLEVDGEDRGYFEPVGPNHSAILTDESPTLVVTFETIASVRNRGKGDSPLGFQLVAENGFSNLCILAHGDTWFRDKYLYGYFDRLIDDGFFEDFDNVVFYGAGMCGYAAAAFSVAAPGATVIAVQPQATLDTEFAGWDKRYPAARRLDFTERYGFAPDMLEGADRAFIVFDPDEEFDAMHASLFNRSNVELLRCRNLGANIQQSLEEMKILQPMIEKACQGGFTALDFFKLYRARREHFPYLRRLNTRTQDDDRDFLSLMLCQNVVSRLTAPKFERRLHEVETRLGRRANNLHHLHPIAVDTATTE